MQLIFSRAAAEELKDKYTILELETIPTENNELLEVFCLVPSESIIMEIQTLDTNIERHKQFVQAIKDNNVETCIELGEKLRYKFGGELDSFYDIIIDRCQRTGSTKFIVPEQQKE